jgi:dihydroorotate dehydrogenase electron transfer subunit
MKRVNIRTVKQGTGELVGLYLEGGLRGGRLLCPKKLIPAPGQYLLAHDHASDVPLPAPVFNAGPIPGGFLIAPPIPQAWPPGTILMLRGPLGHGFTLPANARNVALAALGETSARLRLVLDAALKQGASVVLASNLNIPDLPPEVEIQPVTALAEVVQWADYLAVDIPCESLPELRVKLGLGEQDPIRFDRTGPQRVREAQVLVVTPMPCGGMGDCGVCAVRIPNKWKMACKDGPVFKLNELF